jgi:hypothetical protein
MEPVSTYENGAIRLFGRRFPISYLNTSFGDRDAEIYQKLAPIESVSGMSTVAIAF